MVYDNGHASNPAPNHGGLTAKERRFVAHLRQQYYQFSELPQPTAKVDKANLGYLYPADNPQFLVWIVDKWVAYMDKKLDKLAVGTDEYADVFGQRGFTYAEFKFVLSGQAKESFSRHRIFDYLYLTDQLDREFFIVSNTDDEQSVLDAYVKAIIESVKLEIPILNFFFASKIPLYFPIKALKRGAYLLAQSGAGKSEMLKILFYDLWRRSQKRRNKTLILLEPHSDLSLEVLRFALTANDFTRLVYLDPFIRETVKQIFGYDLLGVDYTFVINPFELKQNVNNSEINYMVQNLSSAFFEILKSTETTQMDALIESCVEVLLRKEGSSIADLKRFMDNDHNTDLIEFGQQIPNEERRGMMNKIVKDKKLISTKSGIFYRLQSLIGDSEFKRLLVGKSTVNLADAMNGGKVIICNLAKARMGKKSAPAFGKLLLAFIQGIATQRQNIPKEKRKETFCFVDEFQNYVTPSIEDIMAESRKYALHMILSHQTYGQHMDSDMNKIVTGNTALKIAGDNGAESIKQIAEHMGNLKPKGFEKLPKYSFFVYNKDNKKNGVKTVRVPDFLIKMKPPFYMPKSKLKEFFLWLVHESGYYKKVEKKPVNPTTPPATNAPTYERPERSQQKKNTPKSSLYDVNFDD